MFGFMRRTKKAPIIADSRTFISDAAANRVVAWWATEGSRDAEFIRDAERARIALRAL